MYDLTKAPECGTVYAVFDNRICYKKYHGRKELEEFLAAPGTLFELHLFDSACEYRYLNIAEGGCLESMITDQGMAAELGWEDKDSGEYIYEESVFVTSENDKQDNLKNQVKVVNYIQYDEDDMLHIVNYRLKEV